MNLVFEKWDRGLIARNVEGPWVVPGTRDEHAVKPQAGRIYEVEITGTASSGKLRFCRVVKDISAMQKNLLDEMQKCISSATSFAEICKRTWEGGKFHFPQINPWKAGCGASLIFDNEGRPAVTKVEIPGPWFTVEHGRIETRASYDPVTIAVEKPLSFGKHPSGPSVLAYLVVAEATGYKSRTAPQWADELLNSSGRVCHYYPLNVVLRLSCPLVL